MRRPLADAANVMNGTLIGDVDAGACYRGAAIDSRRVEGGEIFFALPGERTDGHRFVAAALAAGAAAAVVRTPAGDVGGPQIRVDDVTEALHELTRDHRRLLDIRVAGVTGSAGKTTTKDLLALLLGERWRVRKSPGNLNNLLGFPLTLLATDADCEWLVAEMGMSVPGELAAVSRLGRPDVAIFTNVRPAHLAGFEEPDGAPADVEAIARAKAELLEGLADDGLIVANAGDPRVVGLVDRHLARRGDATPAPAGREKSVIWFEVEPAPGRLPPAEVTAHGVEPLAGEPGTRFTLGYRGASAKVELPLHGRANVENFLAAAACALRLGVPIETVAAAARRPRPGAGRGEVVSLPSGATLVDDSYNSNPEAARLALEAARLLDGRRHVAILGDMLELGSAERRYHRQLGRDAAELGFGLVVGVGELASETVAAAGETGVETAWFEDAKAAGAGAPALIGEGDVVLVKGSRGAALEHLVEGLLQERPN
ncbi:MAG: UDP-N-acetylmuramoyl-tripeptide--D-alanyl-D-alanine ligase [Acidobacteriota bacterium]|nr:UDP-N-acetylmuramoyl-tripeptide--D-alanyl-D-alanine ligase [Acidobacteriota bacterium]